MTKRILHLANWNSTNIGNGALIYGSERIFREDYPGEVEFIPEAWDDYTFKRKKFDETFVQLVNSTDALMVNGAVTFNAFRRTTRNTGMRFDLPLHLWDEIKVPIILYGLSYRCWPFQEYPNREAFIRFLNYAIEHKNVFFGVRNDGTKEWIHRQFGVDSDRIHEIPDPGMFVPYKSDITYEELDSNKRNLLVAFNGEDAVYRYAPRIQRIIWKGMRRLVGDVILEKVFGRFHRYFSPRRRLVRKIARALNDVARERDDFRLVLVPHYLDDYGMIQEFIEEVYEQLAHQRVLTTGLLSVRGTEYFYGRYKQADLVLAMRVHSMSPSIGMGVPVIPVTSQGRMRNFLKKLSIDDIAVDTEDPAFENRLAAKIRDTLDNPAPLQERLREATARAREQFRQKNALIVSLLEGAE